ADKGLLLAAIITLSLVNWRTAGETIKPGFPLWFPVLVITRDVVIMTGCVILHFLVGRVQVKPSWMGKTATFFQMVAIGCAMLQLKVHVAGIDVPVWLAGVFTFASGVGYMMDGI